MLKIVLASRLYFIGNTAEIMGGAVMVANCSPQIENKLLISSGQLFVNNTAGECGGAMHLSNTRNVTTKNVAIDYQIYKKSGLCSC